ncbi:MAG TPA: transporter substrate-binding domain-containing protein [Arsenicitalea sp.]|jgi:polar amino acid transport system substrate-binding protein|nr:transporter substrate-binding domain-containing protein [Arsenicitalea sp.]
MANSALWKCIGLVCRAAILFLAVATPAWAQQAVPHVINPQNFGQRADKYTLSYCVDPRDPAWQIDKSIADAIAGALLVQPKPTLIKDRKVQDVIDSIYRHLLADCDIFFGFKLLPEGYPDWLAISRPYYQVGYVYVGKNPNWKKLADLPKTEAIGSSLGSVADFRLIQYLNSLPPDQRWPRYPMSNDVAALQAVVDGKVGAAVVWAPSFAAAAKADPALAGLHVISSSPLPDLTIPVGALMLKTSTFLRYNIDQAIQSLVRDGTIGAIIEANHFPATLPE